MRAWSALASVVGLFAALAACEGRLPGGTHASRVPLNHRPAGAACPAPRGPGSTSGPTCPDGGTESGPIVEPRACESDTDCAAGTNGRCFSDRAPFATCGTSCSYDACFTDSDCPAGSPCLCRTSAADSTANVCVSGGNCRVDDDCGAGGYCSPSQLGQLCFCPSPALCPDGGTTCTAGNMPVSCACGDACGHSYFCHTKDDACVDDSDCSGGATCNYDTVEKRWTCSTCWPFI